MRRWCDASHTKAVTRVTAVLPWIGDHVACLVRAMGQSGTVTRASGGTWAGTTRGACHMDELIGTQHGDFHLRLDWKSVSRGNTRSPDDQEDRLWYMFDCNPAELSENEQKKRDQQLKAIAGEMAWENEPTDPSSDSQI